MAMIARTITMDDGTDIFVEIHGRDGPPIVFVAGLGDNRLTWAPQVRYLSDRFRIILIDNRGTGKSATPPGPYSTQRMAEDAHQVIANLGFGPVNAIGISMGGAICQHWALRHPADINQLVLSSTWAAPDVLTGVLFDHWKGLADRGDRQALIESLLLFCFSPDYLTEHPETVQEFIAGETLNLEGFSPAAEACRDHDTIESLFRVPHRTLVTIGEHDILIRPALSMAMANELQERRIEIMPTGHMPSWELPDVYSELVAEFFVGPH